MKKRAWNWGRVHNPTFDGWTQFSLFSAMFIGSLGPNKQVSAANLGGATNRSGLKIGYPNLLGNKSGFLCKWEYLRVSSKEGVWVVLMAAELQDKECKSKCDLMSSVFAKPCSLVTKKRVITACQQKAFRHLGRKKSLQRHLCQYLIISVKRE